MKTKYIMSIAVFFIFALVARSQSTSVEITNPITKTGTVLTIPAQDASKITGVVASGSVTFNLPNGNVRILLVNKHGFERMIYESYPLLAQNGKDNFKNMAIETSTLKGLVPDEIKVVIKDAELNNLNFTLGGISAGGAALRSAGANIRSGGIVSFPPIIDWEQIHRLQIMRLNQNLIANGELWRAGDTPFSRLSYEQKKIIFGGVVPELNGAEYYIGGILDIDGKSKFPMMDQSSNYVENFDWRNRHSANIFGSPYFQDAITGWITPIKDQGNCGSCWAFSAAGAVEAVSKLYKNSTYNIDLSEQDLVSCSQAGSCHSGSVASALSYISQSGIQDEGSFEYRASDRPCSEKRPPSFTVKTNGVQLFNDNNSETLKSMLVKSPIAGRIASWRHAMTLVGYKTLRAGDKIYMTAGQYETIQPEDPRIGKTAWIFKNSWGANWGDHGFLYAFVDVPNMNYSASPKLPFTIKNYDTHFLPLGEFGKFFNSNVTAYDKDNDGYYWWGIGPRPSNLPANAKLEEDSDDSDASIGPMDAYGKQTLLKDYDLYIKDNPEDMGFEPNTTIQHQNFWSAPEVWVRHNPGTDDQTPQNPLPNKLNFIYAKVWNRGQLKSPKSKVIAYWAKAGTNLPWPSGWDGTLKMDGYLPLGGFIASVGQIPEIEPGEFAIVEIKWQTPDPIEYQNAPNTQIGGKNTCLF